jgi:hypothetical protein
MIRARKYCLPPWHYWVPHIIHQIVELLEHPYCEKKNPKHTTYKDKWLLNPIACMQFFSSNICGWNTNISLMSFACLLANIVCYIWRPKQFGLVGHLCREYLHDIMDIYIIDKLHIDTTPTMQIKHCKLDRMTNGTLNALGKKDISWYQSI